MRQYRSRTMGFGLAVAWVIAIPVVNLVAIPAAAVGGTILFAELPEKAGGDGAGQPEAGA